MVVPALLTDKIQDLTAMLRLCRNFTDYVQVDIMDGLFVPSKSVTLDEIRSLTGDIGGEAHLMVNDPLPWIEPFKRLGAKAVIYHFEIKEDHKKILSVIKQNGMKAGIAVNPGTRIEEFEYLVKDLDCILFMSVNPGFYGAPFIPEVLKKIRSFKGRYPHLFTAIDGGVKLSNFDDILASGVDMVCVGSAILKAPDQACAYRELVSRFSAIRGARE